MASSTNYPLPVPVPVTPEGAIASTSYSQIVGVELRQEDYTELMPTTSNQTKNVCSTSDISLQVFMSYDKCKLIPLQPTIIFCMFMNQSKRRKIFSI